MNKSVSQNDSETRPENPDKFSNFRSNEIEQNTDIDRLTISSSGTSTLFKSIEALRSKAQARWDQVENEALKEEELREEGRRLESKLQKIRLEVLKKRGICTQVEIEVFQNESKATEMDFLFEKYKSDDQKILVQYQALQETNEREGSLMAAHRKAQMKYLNSVMTTQVEITKELEAVETKIRREEALNQKEVKRDFEFQKLYDQLNQKMSAISKRKMEVFESISTIQAEIQGLEETKRRKAKELGKVNETLRLAENEMQKQEEKLINLKSQIASKKQELIKTSNSFVPTNQNHNNYYNSHINGAIQLPNTPKNHNSNRECETNNSRRINCYNNDNGSSSSQAGNSSGNYSTFHHNPAHASHHQQSRQQFGNQQFRQQQQAKINRNDAPQRRFNQRSRANQRNKRNYQTFKTPSSTTKHIPSKK